MHAVVNAFSRPRIVARRHRRLEIDDSRIGPHSLELGQRIAPDIREFDAAIERAGRTLGQCDIVAGGPRITFEQVWLTGVRENLIDAATGHHITAEE